MKSAFLSQRFSTRLRGTLWAVATASLFPVHLPAAEILESDVCVYGGTSGGVASAVQTARMGKSAMVIESGRHLGGLTSGGLGATDIGNKAAIGGVSREFYQRIARHYSQKSAWQCETADEYFAERRGGQAAASTLSGRDATMWTFEPRVAENT